MRKPRGLFIAGTDTGVGKTILAAGLVRLSRHKGLRGLAVKPVETGCSIQSGELYPEDGVFLTEASENDLSLDECVPFRFSVPASPARAAAMEGTRLCLIDMVEHVCAVSDRADFIIVEGAGGLLVPIQDNLMMIDFIERLGYPTLLVGRTRLGTINHILLSVQALTQRGLEIAGIVLSFTECRCGVEEEFTPGDVASLVEETPVIALRHLEPEIRSDPLKIALEIEQTFPTEMMRKWFGVYH
jgi:dethiobiotin synthetase